LRVEDIVFYRKEIVTYVQEVSRFIIENIGAQNLGLQRHSGIL
jgi:hypothetical protein